jgi:NitT/TauT family transport system substrate-binding protein
MHPRRPFRFWWSLGLLLVAMLLSAPPAAAEGTRLRLGILPVVDTLPLLVGEAEGLFAAQGLTVELIAFQSALERDAALQAGGLDGYFGDLLNTLLLIRSGENLRILTTAFHTHPDHRMFGVVAAPGSGIAEAAGLAGREVAISRATVIEYLLDRLLTARGLEPASVSKLDIKKIPIRLQMLLEGQVAAALLPEPLLTLAESKGGRVLLDDRVLDTSETVVALTRKALEGDPGLAPRFRTAYAQAVESINNDPERYKDLLVARTQFPLPVKDRFRVPVFPAVRPPAAADLDAVQDWLAANGMGGPRLAYLDVVLMP